MKTEEESDDSDYDDHAVGPVTRIQARAKYLHEALKHIQKAITNTTSYLSG